MTLPTNTTSPMPEEEDKEREKNRAKRTKEELTQELNTRTDHIERHLAALQEEVTTLGPALGKAIFTHPLVSVGGALLAGLAVGLLFGGRKRPDRSMAPQALVERYVEALVNEARQRVRRGQDSAEAVRAVLEDRVPVIVMEADEPQPRGMGRQTLQVLYRSALGMGLTYAINFISNNLLGDSATASQGVNPPRDPDATDAAIATATASEALDD